MKFENYELDAKAVNSDDYEPRLKERIDSGRGKRWNLEIEYSESVDKYRWTISCSTQSWNGYEDTLEAAVDVAMNVYRDYMGEEG